jgi:hypothetical protein
VQRHKVSVGVRDVAAAEAEGDPLNALDPLQGLGQALADANDRGRQVRWQIVEIGHVDPGQNLDVTLPDRIDVKHSQDALVRVDNMGRRLTLDDPAEGAGLRVLVGHGALLVVRAAKP